MSRAVYLDPLEACPKAPSPPASADSSADRWPPAYGRSEPPFLPLLASAQALQTKTISDGIESAELRDDDPGTEEVEPGREDGADAGEIASLAASLRAEAHAEWRQLCDGIATRFAAAAALVLDDLIEAHGPDLLAARARALLQRVQAPEIAIAAAPVELAALRTALRDDVHDQGIPVCADPTVAPGQLRLAWQDGGAEVDLAALRHLADELLRAQPCAPTDEEPR